MAGTGSEQAAELLRELRVFPERAEELRDPRPIIDDPVYGEEVALKLMNGFEIRTAAGAEGERLFGGSYVRIVKDDGEENGYWHCDEWQNDPLGVMGAILASASGIELRRRPTPEARLAELEKSSDLSPAEIEERDRLRSGNWRDE